jgi:glycosyltransferase involved in cell wall biosynthesis
LINPISKPAGCPPVSVIICALNEAENLPYVLPKIPSWVDEVLLVDGHSTDGTLDLARKLCPKVRTLCQKDRGKGNAIRLGIQEAHGEIIITLDADGSTDPSEIPDFIIPLLNGYDFAKGSRFLNQIPTMPFHRRFGNRMFVFLTNILFKTNYTDLTAGLNACWKTIIPKIDPQEISFLDEPTVNIRLKKRNLNVIEIPQRDKGRIMGKANERFMPQGWRILRTILMERFHG